MKRKTNYSNLKIWRKENAAMYKNELVLHPEITRVTWRKINPETTIENICIIDKRAYYSKNNCPIEICVCTAEKPEDIAVDEDDK